MTIICLWLLRYAARQREFLVILGHFLLFYPTNDLNNQYFEKMKKKILEILSFYTSLPKIVIICSTVSEIWCMTDLIFIFYFGLFFVKKRLQILSFYTCVPKYGDVVSDRLIGKWTERKKKWYIEAGVPLEIN